MVRLGRMPLAAPSAKERARASRPVEPEPSSSAPLLTLWPSGSGALSPMWSRCALITTYSFFRTGSLPSRMPTDVFGVPGSLLDREVQADLLWPRSARRNPAWHWTPAP